MYKFFLLVGTSLIVTGETVDWGFLFFSFFFCTLLVWRRRRWWRRSRCK